MSNNNHGLTTENMLATLPLVLRNDLRMYALASSVADILAKRPAEIDNILIYSRIDSLPEELLDILAYDFKIDWWDRDFSVEEKRRTLKDSFQVHRMLGTKAAVETAISAIYPETKVEEWFDYGGEPYTFRLEINATDLSIDSDRHKRILNLVNYYKNLRSHLDRIKYIVYPTQMVTFCASAFTGCYMQVTANVQLSGKVDRPHGSFIAQSGARVAQTYGRIEVMIHGME